MHRSRILASAIGAAIVAAAMTQGCSSDSGDDTSAGGTGTGGNAGSAGSTGGSAGSTGGSAGSTGGSAGSTGGSAGSTGGNSGSSGGSAGTTGGSAGSGGSTQCGSGISNGTTACTGPCTGSVCGLADLGRRDCACTNAVYECDSCAFSGDESILQQPTEPLEPCEEDEATLKGSACTENEARCQPTDLTHVCACWAGEWDCDDNPWE
jgi:hypothetical protein